MLPFQTPTHNKWFQRNYYKTSSLVQRWFWNGYSNFFSGTFTCGNYGTLINNNKWSIIWLCISFSWVVLEVPKRLKWLHQKTFFKPFCVNAEHSTYLTALNSRASLSPCSTDIGFCLVFASFSTIPASSRRSTCVPTSKNGVLGQWCVISGTHYKKDITWCVNPTFRKKG